MHTPQKHGVFGCACVIPALLPRLVAQYPASSSATTRVLVPAAFAVHSTRPSFCMSLRYRSSSATSWLAWPASVAAGRRVVDAIWPGENSGPPSETLVGARRSERRDARARRGRAAPEAATRRASSFVDDAGGAAKSSFLLSLSRRFFTFFSLSLLGTVVNNLRAPPRLVLSVPSQCPPQPNRRKEDLTGSPLPPLD